MLRWVSAALVMSATATFGTIFAHLVAGQGYFMEPNPVILYSEVALQGGCVLLGLAGVVHRRL